MANVRFDFDFRNLIRPPPDLILEGSAALIPRTCLRLVEPLPMKWGRAMYRNSVPFSKETTFETNITFTVQAMPNDPTPADGLVFFIAPMGYSFALDPCDGNFGIFDPSDNGKAPNVFAVEFDVFVNDWDPPHAPHVGIDIESRVSKVYVNIDSSYIGNQVTMNIKYAGKEITVSVTNTSVPKPDPLTVGYICDRDLSAILDCREVEVGLGSSTGRHVELLDVFDWNFTSTTPN